MKVRLEKRASALRCVVCHDGMLAGRRRCRTCGAFFHCFCGAEMGRCPTLGCGADLPNEAPAWEPGPVWHGSGTWLTAIVILTTAVPALGGAVGFVVVLVMGP